VRNEERFVERAMLSILRQTFRDLELLAVDAGSTDATGDILASLAASDARVRIIRPGGRGLVEALNAGIAAATGTYIARMDADDISLPERLARQVEELDRRPQLGVIGTRVRYIDAENRPVGVWDVPVGAELVHWALAFGTPIAHPSVMMRRVVLPPVPYRTAEPHAEDYDLWVRLSRGTTLDNLADRLVDRRVHGSSVSDRHEGLQQASTLRIQQREIASVLGEVPSVSQVAALSDPHSPLDLLTAAVLIARLYLASPRGRDIRRDAWARFEAAAKLAWRTR
jgi:glycosyltransferase involved in cell wall biosynthesis